MDIGIRDIREQDIPAVVDIQIAGWGAAYRGILDTAAMASIKRPERIAQRKKDYRDTGFLVAEGNGQILGFCRYTDTNRFSQNIPEIDCELLALYVKPEFKFQGIGTKLFQFAVNRLREQNRTKMILWCLNENEPSKRFYTKMGGVIIQEKPIEIGGKDYDEVGFCYDLGSNDRRNQNG